MFTNVLFFFCPKRLLLRLYKCFVGGSNTTNFNHAVDLYIVTRSIEPAIDLFRTSPTHWIVPGGIQIFLGSTEDVILLSLSLM